MTWHKAPEYPKPDTEVLAEVKGFNYSRFVVLKHDGIRWWQHLPRLNAIVPTDEWVVIGWLIVISWAYIEEESK